MTPPPTTFEALKARMTDTIAQELGTLLKGSPGKCAVNLQVVSKHDNIAIEAPSKSLSVTVTEELVRGLDGITEVEWALN